ncbi:hypothetical protein KFK09_004008 [Dendrobium nobile]|uniref:CCHC-type domain-containing protein n=1 Tax=Dendrobium nobile TaxID=94219 RepID=A0A8T3C4S0_DENNO|nr:hypothetical protein KFK09_004008 [Dendrobium nobile]
MEGILMGGPWFVNGDIIGMERWTAEFSTLSLKGLTSPIWIILPHLPLQCWDEVNMARLATMVGRPLMLDGNLFQWGKREFARVCIMVKLDQSLPTGVWVDSISGIFFQRVEYERISSFCYDCGMVGHLKMDCKRGNSTPMDSNVINDNGREKQGVDMQSEENNGSKYGP